MAPVDYLSTVLDTNITTAPACASPEGAPSLHVALTSAAGAQTGAVVVASVEIDLDDLDTRIPTVARVTFGDGTVGDYSVWLDTGVAVGSSGVCTLPYCGAPWPEHTTAEQDAAAEVAVVKAWAGQEVA